MGVASKYAPGHDVKKRFSPAWLPAVFLHDAPFEGRPSSFNAPYFLSGSARRLRDGKYSYLLGIMPFYSAASSIRGQAAGLATI